MYPQILQGQPTLAYLLPCSDLFSNQGPFQGGQLNLPLLETCKYAFSLVRSMRDDVVRFHPVRGMTGMTAFQEVAAALPGRNRDAATVHCALGIFLVWWVGCAQQDRRAT